MTNPSCTPAGRFPMRTRGPMPRSLRAGRRLPGWAVAVGRFAERLRIAFLTWQRRRADIDAFAGLGDAVLRDVGTTRAEIESWSAEAEGQVERTRRHVAVRSLNAKAHLSFFLKL